MLPPEPSGRVTGQGHALVRKQNPPALTGAGAGGLIEVRN
jgi:hypothetical protein